ncbi:hypothetical protein [Thauera humireducens]|nr:hypothetical protein [Thauera humireducens]
MQLEGRMSQRPDRQLQPVDRARRSRAAQQQRQAEQDEYEASPRARLPA